LKARSSPRLRQIRHPGIDSAFARLEQVEEEHHWAAPSQTEVERLGAQYQQHISVEDELAFPLAARMLSAAEKSAIAEEMASRRKVRLTTEISEFHK
jgi:hypothetical protein